MKSEIYQEEFTMKRYYFVIEYGRVTEISKSVNLDGLNGKEAEEELFKRADIVVRAENYQEALCMLNLKHIEENY